GVGEISSVIEREVRVGIAQDQGGDAAALEFLTETAGKGDGNVFFSERGTEGLAAIVSSVARIHDGEVTAWGGNRRGCRRRLGGGHRVALHGVRGKRAGRGCWGSCGC